MRTFPPERIVCLTEETVETLYLLGQQDRIVGVSGFAVRPKGVRREKPRVSAFTSADIPKIMALKPDVVLTFSDLQADIVAALLREGLTVIGYNQRDLAGIMAMIRQLGALVGCTEQAEALAQQYEQRLHTIRASNSGKKRIKVYFEEWDDPMISGIQWVSELVGIAGGEDCFSHLGYESHAKNRIIAESQTVIDANPDVIIGSWCGKKFRPEKVAARPGWDQITAVKNQALYEIKSPLILQPGPAALTDGLDELHKIIASVA